jgi:hypothetical protein
VPPPDTQFFAADGNGRLTGGLIALDGVHPTSIGYGILAQEVIRVMERAGVIFSRPASPLNMDFAGLLAEDKLVSEPPATLVDDLHIVGWINQQFDIVKTLLRHGTLT